MSHFVAYVLCDKKDNFESRVSELLAPYMENCCETPDKKYMVFSDVEDERRKEYECEGTDQVQLDNGAWVWPWSECFRVPGTFGSGTGTHKVPDDLMRVKRSFKDIYPTFDKFMADWVGLSKDPEMGRYGYWENPNARWDWYQIGGRWSTRFASNTRPVKQLTVTDTNDTPFAVVTPDGKWHEKGEVGWWGVVHNEREEQSWMDEVRSIYAQNQDKIAVVVDCHI